MKTLHLSSQDIHLFTLLLPGCSVFSTQEMERRENRDQRQPLGICQRLINFVMKNLVAQSFKRIGYAPIASAKSQEVEFGPVDAHEEVLDSGGWIPVEVAKEWKALPKTIAVEDDDDDDDDGYERVREEESGAGEPVAIREVHQHLHVDEHFEEFIKRMKEKIRKPSFSESSESVASKARDGSSK